MPYKTNKDLPENVTHVLPAHAQDIYRDAFNHTWQEYASPGERRGELPRKKRRIRWHGQR